MVTMRPSLFNQIMATMFLRTASIFKPLMLKMITSSTFNFPTILMAQQNQTFGVVISSPFLFMAQSNTLLRIWRTLNSLSQTSFSLYLHNQWTDLHKLSYAEKPQMRAICIYVEYTKATTNDWDIRPSVTVKDLSANISWTAEQIHMIELALGSAHQFVYNDIWCISKWQVLVEIQAYKCSDIISYLLKLAWQLLWQLTAPIRYKFWSCDGNSLCMDHHSFVYIPLYLRTRPQT